MTSRTAGTSCPTGGEEQVRVEDVELVTARGLTWICEVRGMRFGVPRQYVCDGTEVRHSGDRGRLVLPERVARDLGLC